MTHYHLYCFSNGEIYRCEDIQAPTDGAAMKAALDLRGFTAAELWEDDRKVHVFGGPLPRTANPEINLTVTAVDQPE